MENEIDDPPPDHVQVCWRHAVMFAGSMLLWLAIAAAVGRWLL